MKTQQPDDMRLGPAPRLVPWSLRLYLLLLYGQFPVFFLGMGLAAFFGFVLHADVKALLFTLPTRSALGTVVALRDTGAAEGGGRHSRGNPIYAASYTYQIPGGPLRRDVSFSVGTWQFPSADPDTVGDDTPILGRGVPVQYVARYPGVSRIRGLRSNIFGPDSLFAVVFLLAGLGLTYGLLTFWRRMCLALASGAQDPATGGLHMPEEATRRAPARTKGRVLLDAGKPAPPKDLLPGDLMTGRPPVRDGLLQPPHPRSLFLVCILPTLMLLLVIATLRQHY